MASPETIGAVLNEISVAYPKFMENDERLDEAIKVWAVYLADIPDDLLLVAVRKFISSSDHPFAPSIPEIRKMATSLRLEVQQVPLAYEAWDEVMRAPKPRPVPLWRDGQIVEEKPYQWSHEIVYNVARRLGWPDRFPDGETLMADRSHFLKAYDAELQKVTQQETRLKLVDEYVESERQLLLEDRNAAFDTGEREFLNDQVRAVARKMA
jgi:hypothetical protein